MFKVGDIVRYKNGWCSDGERKYLHIVKEVRINPITNQMTRYLIETVNMEHMTLNPTETVDECMIEYAEAEETKGDNTMNTNTTNKKSISVSNLTLDLYLNYVRPAAIRAGILEDAITEEGRPYHITEEAIANEIESCMRCACFNAGNDGVQRTHEEYIAHEAEQMLYQIEVSIKYSKDPEVVEALEALKNAMTAEAVVMAVEKKVSETKTRSAWDRGVKAYAEELVEELREAVEGGYVDTDDLSNRRMFEKAMLNGASDWWEFSEGGCSLIYNQDIAERLCTKSELIRTEFGRRNPNSRENWITVQGRALYQAAQMVLRAAF